MLKLSTAQVEKSQNAAEADFVARVRDLLNTRHPAFLSAYPELVADWILGNMITRARAFGATWESNIAKLCDMMVVLAPNLLSAPEVYARIHPAYRRIGENRPLAVDLRLKNFDQRLDDASLSAIVARRSDIELYTPVELDGQGVEARTSFALRLLLNPRPDKQEASELARAGVEAARGLGVVDHADGPLLAAAALKLAPELARAVRLVESDSPGVRVDALRAALLAETGQKF